MEPARDPLPPSSSEPLDELDESDDRFPKKIRNASKAKVPFVLIAGEDDRSAGAVSFRYRDGSQKNGVPREEALAELLAAVEQRS